MLLILGTVSTHAQYYFLNVYQKDGAKVEYMISALDSINITEKIPTISLNYTTLSLVTGKQSQLNASVKLGSTTLNVPVSWSSDNNDVATVNETGKVTAISTGNATITVASEGQTATCLVTVTKPVEGRIKVNYYGCQILSDHVDINIFAENQLVEANGYGINTLKKNWQSAVCYIGDNKYELDATDGASFRNSDSYGKYHWTWAFKNTTVKNALSKASETNPVKIIMTDVEGAQYIFIFNIPQTSSKSYYMYYEEDNGEENEEDNGEYEYVDLGLSVKWATFNVGATKPEEYGDYYAWGETETKDTCNWSTYKWCNGSISTLTKYCNDSSYGHNGFTDTKTTLDPDDDVAHVKWGGDWRMPTKGEFTELFNNCTWTWTKLNGVNGYRVTSKKSGYTDRSIFLPAAGYRGDTSLGNVGSYGNYWSSSLYTGGPFSAWIVVFGSGYRNASNGYRFYGLSVRPVCPSEEWLNAVSITLNSNLDSIVMGNTITLSATVKHGNEVIDREVTWTSDNPSIASVDATGVVFGKAVGSTTITATCMGKTATCTITVIEPQNENGNGITSISLEKTSLSLIIGVWDSLKAIALNGNEVVDTAAIIWQSNNEPVATVDSTGLVRAITVGTATIKATCGDKYATCIVTVLNHNDVTHEYVDLGLSVKWATCNVGAIRPEDHGGYYAWGETESKIEYKWENYKWCDGWWSKLTKYNSISVWGTVDNKKILDPEDDVVQANWGNNWRIPSPEELKELVDNCTWTWTTVDGIKGYSVTSNKTGYTDRSIFLPADGYFHYYDFVGFGQKGYYVSNTTGKSFNPGWPDCLVFDSEKKSVINSDIGRNFGFSIRPVCSK